MLKEYKLEQNFYITGYRNDIPAFTHLADLIVVASTGTEAQSRVAPQAFSTRKTVVSTNVGGLTEIVKNNYNGLVIPPNNPELMASAILKILNNSELKTNLEKNAYLLAQQELSFDYMMQKTINLYQKYMR